MKRIYAIKWMEQPNEKGERLHNQTTIRRDSLIKAINDVCEYFGIKEEDIIETELRFITE